MLTSVAAVFRGRAERKVIDAGYDPARLPPGQYLTEKWPVLHAGSIPRTDLATWDFFVSGDVENPIRISWDELNALPRTTHTQDIHCGDVGREVRTLESGPSEQSSLFILRTIDGRFREQQTVARVELVPSRDISRAQHE